MQFGKCLAAGAALGLLFVQRPAVGAEGIDAVTVALPVVAPSEFRGDVRDLPRVMLPPRGERPYRPRLSPPVPAFKQELPGAVTPKAAEAALAVAAAPAPSVDFEGIARLDSCIGGQCGDGTPPDPNGEVGPNHYIEAVNSAYGIYDKSGTLLAAFTENQLWAGDSTLCATDSFGDPVVVYDALADRWILSHFAFQLSGNDTVAPYYQCIAVSKTADPVAGGWWLYPVRVDDQQHPWLNDYAKFGIWTDCLYMAANEFSGNGLWKGTLFASFSRADMYTGAPLTASIGYLTGHSSPFSMVPSHLGGQSGAALPPNTPNYFVSESQSLFAFEVRKFTAGANCGAGGTLGSAVVVSQASYTVPSGAIAPQPGTTNTLDVIDDRVMQKVQYRKVGAQESLWVAHTFRSSASGPTGIQWAQLDVTAGTVATAPVQQQKYDPADGLYRFMPSISVDRQGNAAVGYTTSGASAPRYPSIAYAGRLAGDPPSTFGQSETQLIAGGGSQTGNCGGAPCDRWGDYSAMSVDPADDCTFWLTNEYYPGPFDPNTIAWHTRIGAFRYSACTPVARTADLAITKTDGQSSVAPGGSITYTIVVTNNGPFAVTGATVVDTLPAAITGATWTCVASAGDSCPAAGSGSINTSSVNLMKGGTATFTVAGTVSLLASGSLTNVATVNVPEGFTDPVAGNNSATDIDAIVAGVNPPNIAKSFAPSAVVVGQPSVLTITITNPNGGSALTGIAFSDPLPAGVAAPNAAGLGCGGTVTVSVNVVTLANGSLAAGANCVIPVPVTGAQAQIAPWTNTIASVTSNEGGTNSTPATAAITVSAAATTTAIVSDPPDPSVVGQAYTVTYGVAVVAPGAGTPSGTVTVSDGGAQCTGTLPVTSCQLTSTSAGAKSLTATYNGSTNFAGSTSAAAPHQVNKATTTTSIVSDAPDPSAIGQPYTVTYSVAIAAPGAGAPSGTVTVSDGSAQCVGTLPVTSCQLTSTAAGVKNLIATYGGDANFNGSASAAAPHQVNLAATTTTIASDLPDPSVVGQPYTVAFTVSAGAGSPTGTVTVSDGSAQCIGTLSAANCQLTSTSAGAKSLVATYSGDSTFDGSTSAAVPHQVGKASTATAIVGDIPDPSLINQPYLVSYAVSVAAPGAGTPGGNVTVSDGTDQCVGTLPATSCALTSTTPGAKSLTATYGGDADYNGSVSAPAGHAVAATAHTLTVVRNGSGTGTVSSGDTLIDCGGSCAHAYPDGTLVVLTATPDAGSMFTGWLGACTGTGPCSVTIGGDTTVFATFAPTAIGTHVLDVDDNGAYDPFTDAVLVVRTLLALTGDAVTSDALGLNAQRSTSGAIATYLTDVLPLLDVDGNGSVDALTDGLLIVRYMLGVREAALTAGALGTDATRTLPADIGSYLQSLMP